MSAYSHGYDCLKEEPLIKNPALVERQIAERQREWLRVTYGITPNELLNSPLQFRGDVQVAWARYWRNECEQGRGVSLPFPHRTRGVRRSA